MGPTVTFRFSEGTASATSRVWTEPNETTKTKSTWTYPRFYPQRKLKKEDESFEAQLFKHSKIISKDSQKSPRVAPMRTRNVFPRAGKILLLCGLDQAIFKR
jgi:hypothetical protein